MIPHSNRQLGLQACHALLAVLVLFNFGCSGVAGSGSKSSGLKEVHAVYRQEFAGFALPKGRGPANQPSQAASFDKTLAAISTYRSEHSTPATQNRSDMAHLTVLEGMIYIQTRQFGLASTLKNDVAAAVPSLNSKSGDEVRDKLIAESYAPLLDGWKITSKSQVVTADGPPLERSADQIGKVLSRNPSSKASDDGALYLATSAAIFYVWVDHIQNRPFSLEKRKALYGKGRDLMSPYLSDHEKKLARAASPDSTELGGRLRFLLWYDFLSDVVEPEA